ncbi:phosphodiesterase [Spongiibacter taiwanensis]
MSSNSVQRPLHVVQISDCHLGGRAGETLLGLDTDRSLEVVLQQVAGGAKPDLLIVSGDISSDGQVDAYHRLKARLQGMAGAMVWLPGNHDDAVQMRAAIGAEIMPGSLLLEGWQFVFLNTAVPGQVGGRLAASELEKVRLAASSGMPTLIFMHHHALPVGSDWLDEQRVSNADELFSLIGGQTHIKALVCGHVHQESDQNAEGIRQISTPSSCIQFAPGSEDFALDSINPGYRCFALHGNGTFETQVKRVAGNFAVDHSARGY